MSSKELIEQAKELQRQVDQKLEEVWNESYYSSCGYCPFHDCCDKAYSINFNNCHDKETYINELRKLLK